MVTKTLLFVVLVGTMFLFGVSVRAQGYHYGPPPMAAPPPPVIVQPPAVLVPAEPRCRIVRETHHDDILDTNNWTEREVCDED